MFTSNLKKSVQMSVLCVGLISSAMVHAQAAPMSDVAVAIEKHSQRRLKSC